MQLEDLKVKIENRERKSFYSSDYGKGEVELYLSFKNIPKTNPPTWNETLKWGAGKGVENAMLQVLKDSGIVVEEYNQEEHGRVNMIRNGVEIHGYIDAITKTGEPIEIKSINNANQWDIQKYRNNQPRENYVGQLASYMDFLDKKTGYLFVSSIDGLSYFRFVCTNIGGRKYRCGDITIDLDTEYTRWAKLWEAMKDPNWEPNWFEKVYKQDIEKVDWKNTSISAIQKARNGSAVVGDWEVKWSGWKDLIIKKQGSTLGYSDDEIRRIKELTKNYSSKK